MGMYPLFTSILRRNTAASTFVNGSAFSLTTIQRNTMPTSDPDFQWGTHHIHLIQSHLLSITLFSTWINPSLLSLESPSLAVYYSHHSLKWPLISCSKLFARSFKCSILEYNHWQSYNSIGCLLTLVPTPSFHTISFFSLVFHPIPTLHAGVQQQPYRFIATLFIHPNFKVIVPLQPCHIYNSLFIVVLLHIQFYILELHLIMLRPISWISELYM